VYNNSLFEDKTIQMEHDFKLDYNCWSNTCHFVNS